MQFHKIQYISQGVTAAEQKRHVQAALDAGVQWIQLRWKNATPLELQQLAEEIRHYTQNYQAKLIINDAVVIAAAVEADGVHLGLQDEAVAEARKQLGDRCLIGGTANSFSEVQQRIEEGCDYIGLGPYKFTSTKQNLSPLLGIDGYRKIIESLNTQQISYPPIYAIGGIALSDIDLLQSTGIYGVALSGLLTKKPALYQDIKTKLE